jgi:hypothetical protein
VTTYKPGDTVMILDNPHHPDASGIVGEVVGSRPGVGGTLVDVRYQRPRDGSEHVMPFGTAGLDRGDREAILARAARHEDQADRLRAMAAEVSR